MTARLVRRERWLIVATVCALTLPFVAKPFHIDDDVYIKGARQILAEPWNPLGGTQHLLGETMPVYHFTQHPPLVSYWIALAVRATGEAREIPLHLWFLPFPLLAGLAMLQISRRFTRSPALATSLLLGTPAFLIMSHGLMTDLPMLSLGLAATACFIRGVDERRAGLLAVAGLLLAAASLVQYRALILVPLLGAYAYLRGTLRQATWLAVPTICVSLLWSLHTYSEFGVVHMLDAGSWLEFQPVRIVSDATAYVAFLGGTSVFPALSVWSARGTRRSAWFGLSVVSLGIAATLPATYTWNERAAFFTFFFAGSTLLMAVPPWRSVAGALRSAVPSRWCDETKDDVFLVAMMAVPLASQIVLNLFASARSLLLTLPFLILLLVRRLNVPGPDHAAGRVGVVLGVGLSLAIGVADYDYASAARDVARYSSAVNPDGPRWFTGEWGFRHYIEREGFAPIASDGAGVREGDLLAVPDTPAPAFLEDSLVARLRPVGVIESAQHFPLKVMSFSAHAGFYSNFHGALPFALSAGPLERVRLFRITAPVASATSAVHP